jgi:tRNA1Val (adenine37-N6)-methyltransferase
MMESVPFHFKNFSVTQHGVAHALGTDGVLLGAWADTRGRKRVLDIGTGTGIVALMLAQREPEALVTGIDIHPPSVRCARTNFEASPWAGRLEAREISLQELASAEQAQYDLIVSNPPFFSEATRSPDPERSLGRHTATLSPAELAASVSALLSPSGHFCLILPVKEGRIFGEAAIFDRLYCNREVRVRTYPDRLAERLLMTFSKDPGYYRREYLTLFDPTGGKTPEFRQMTSEFYLY